MIKNIVFDMGQVLIHWEPQVLCARTGMSMADSALLAKELFVSPYWVMLDRGTATEDEVVAAVSKKLPEKFAPAISQLVHGWWKRPLTPMEGMGDLIKELKENGYNIYLLSNANLRLRDYFSRIPGSKYFDGLMVSAEEKLLKPEHEMFERLYERFHLVPEECFFVDDNPSNVEAAIHSGMPAVVFYADAERLRRDMDEAGIRVRSIPLNWIEEAKKN